MKNKDNFITSEKNVLLKISSLLEKNFKNFLQGVITDIFSKNSKICRISYKLNPKRLQEIIIGEIKNFIDYIKTQDVNLAAEKGKQASILGLDENIMQTILEMFRNLFQERLHEKNNAALFLAWRMDIDYRTAYMKAFNKQELFQKLKQQEGLFNALAITNREQHEQIIQLQKEQVSALKKENEERVTLLVNLAHDIKLPLFTINAAVDRAIKQAGNRKIPAHETIKHEASDLKEMVMDILDSERIIRGDTIYNHDNKFLNISGIIKEKIKNMESLVLENNITITYNISPDQVIQMHPWAFDRILNNIIGNSIKYNREGGSIHIDVTGDDKFVTLAVHDTGTGISKKQLKNIFLPYYQAAQKKKNIQGMGAGLPLVKNFLTPVKAKIEIKSKVGKGTSVIITFRKAKMTEKQKKLVLEHIELKQPVRCKNIKLQPFHYDEKKKTILIVEDDLKLLKVLQDSLYKNFNVYCTKSALEALRNLKFIPKPQIILSDIKMPGLDGYGFLESLKQIDEMEDIPVMFLSVKTSEQDQINGYKAGVVGYIRKPFSMPVLLEKIRSFIRYREILAKRSEEKVVKRIEDFIQLTGHERTTNIRLARIMDKFNLSGREREVIQLILQGMSNREIADILCISISTVRSHIENIKIKCKVKTKNKLFILFHS